MPEIQIDKLAKDEDAGLDELHAHSGEPAAPATEISAPRMTDSLQFVLPQSDAVPEPAPGQSIISRAVARSI